MASLWKSASKFSIIKSKEAFTRYFIAGLNVYGLFTLCFQIMDSVKDQFPPAGRRNERSYPEVSESLWGRDQRRKHRVRIQITKWNNRKAISRGQICFSFFGFNHKFIFPTLVTYWISRITKDLQHLVHEKKASSIWLITQDFLLSVNEKKILILLFWLSVKSQLESLSKWEPFELLIPFVLLSK